MATSRPRQQLPVLQALAAVLLLAAAYQLHGTRGYHRYDYYEALRWTVLIAWGLATYCFYVMKGAWQIAAGAGALIALLFNPIVPLTMRKADWQPYDSAALWLSVAAAAVLLWHAYITSRKATTLPPSQSPKV